MNLNSNDFFGDLDVLNDDASEARQEMAEDTQEREPQVDDNFNSDSEPEPVGSDETVDDTEDNLPAKPYAYRNQAKAYVNLLNVGNGMIFPKVYKKHFFSEPETVRLKQLADQSVSMLSEADLKLQNKFAEVEELIQNIPFTDDEKNELIDALADVLRTQQVKGSPVATLIMALIVIEGARALPLFTM